MVRKFKTQDIDEVMEIWLDTNIKAHDFIDKNYWKEHYEEVKYAILNTKVYVYEKDNKILGFIGIIDGYIAGIFVKDGMQGNGIGKILIDTCKKDSNELTLNVYEQNEKAFKFYLREGFYIVSKNIDNDTKENELCMEWKKKR